MPCAHKGLIVQRYATPQPEIGMEIDRRALMKWITRANVKVDRVACPWLISTFVDKEAEFLFVPVDQVESVARETGAIPYDTSGAELGHHGEECSFDAIVQKHGIKDEAIDRLALIVRGADTP